MDLLGQLDSGGGRADNEHAAISELIGAAVVQWADLIHARRNLGRQARDGADVASAAGQHHASAPPRALVGRHVVAVVVIVGLRHSGHRGAGVDGRIDGGGIPLEEADELVPGHETVGIAGFVSETRESRLPVRSEQGERVPPLRPPGVGNVAAFEHDVVDGPVGHALAHREPVVATAHDHNR